jgi:hypothetical protein
MPGVPIAMFTELFQLIAPHSLGSPRGDPFRALAIGVDQPQLLAASTLETHPIPTLAYGKDRYADRYAEGEPMWSPSGWTKVEMWCTVTPFRGYRHDS